MPLYLTFATPEKPLLFEHEIESVVVPTEQGEVQILPGHARYLASLGAGLVRYRESGKTFRLALAGGFLSVENDRVKILADEAVAPSHLEAANVLKNLLTSAQSRLHAAKSLEENDEALREMEKAKAWIELSRQAPS